MARLTSFAFFLFTIGVTVGGWTEVSLAQANLEREAYIREVDELSALWSYYRIQSQINLIFFNRGIRDF